MNKEQFGPEFRIVGKISPEEKEDIKKEYSGRFGEKHLENISEESQKELKRLEYPKTPIEATIVSFANQKTNELRKKAGVKEFDIPERNLHIIPPDLYKKELDLNDESNATTVWQQQAIFLNADTCRENDFKFSKICFHEQLHLKSHVAFEATKKKEKEEARKPDAATFRGGLVVSSTRKMNEQYKKHSHFKGLNEAIASYHERDYFKEFLKLPMFKKEKEWMDSEEAKKIKKELAKKFSSPEEEFLYIKKEIKDGKENYPYITNGYPHHVYVLEYLISEIQKELPDRYSSTDEINTEFLKSLFTGKLLNIAHPIEKTFGKGSFETLGMMDDKENSAIQMLDYLRRARTRQLKKEKQTHGS